MFVNDKNIINRQKYISSLFIFFFGIKINTMSNTKIEDKYENPIDVVAYKLCDVVDPVFEAIKATPNQITTLSLILGLLCVYYMHPKHKNKNLAFACYWLSFFFDCLDGYHARKHKMFSKFGDKYDHYSDFVKHLLIYAMLYVNLQKKIFIYFNLIVGFVFIGMLVQTGCQEKLYAQTLGEEEAQKHSSYLSAFKSLCPNPETITKYSKFFGVGTVTLIFSIFILQI